MLSVLHVAWVVPLEHAVRRLENRPRILALEDTTPQKFSHRTPQNPCNSDGRVVLVAESLQQLTMGPSLPKDDTV